MSFNRQQISSGPRQTTRLGANEQKTNIQNPDKLEKIYFLNPARNIPRGVPRVLVGGPRHRVIIILMI